MWAVVYIFIPICLKCIFRACFLDRWVAECQSNLGEDLKPPFILNLVLSVMWQCGCGKL